MFLDVPILVRVMVATILGCMLDGSLFVELCEDQSFVSLVPDKAVVNVEVKLWHLFLHPKQLIFFKTNFI